MIINADKNIFEEIKQENKLFLLDVYANWCGPCQMMSREFEKLDDDVFFDIVKVDSDENYDLASQLKVVALPTLIVFKDGKEVERLEGFKRAEDIVALVEKHK